MLSSPVKITNSLSAVWLIEFDTYRWATSSYTYDNHRYTGKIQDFNGVDESLCKPEDNSIQEKKISFCIPDDNNVIAGSKGDSVILRLIINDQQFLSWNFRITTFTKLYNKAEFECVDFLTYLIEDSDWPKTDLINPLDTSDATHSGSENACVPVIFGNPYIPLRSLLVGSNRAYVLGPDDGSTYTIDAVSYPVEWDEKAEYLSSEYTFTQASSNGLRVFVPYIASGGTAGFFQNSGSLLDMPTKFSKSTTSTTTNFADILSQVFQDIGLSSAQIDTTSFTACSTIYDTLGLDADCGFFEKEDLKTTLSKILLSCNSTINIYDKIYLKYLGDASLATVNRNDISNFSFSEDVLKNINDAGIAEYYESVQAGDPKQIYVPTKGSTYTNSSTDTVLFSYINNTVLIQQLARIYFRKKFWKMGEISFEAKKRYLKYECGDKLTIQDDIYENGDYIISSKKIGSDLSLSFSCSRYFDDLGQIEDYEPDPVTLVSDTSNRVYYSAKAYNTINFVNAANCRIYGTTITKVSGSASWINASCYSIDSKLNSVKVSFKPTQINAALAIGISQNPTTGINYTGMDYCWMLKTDATCEAFALGVSLGTFGSYTLDSLFEIIYDGYRASFYINGSHQHTVSGLPYGLRFYFDSSFYTLDAGVNSILFEEYADVTQTSLNNGVITSGYIGDKAIDDDPTLGIDFNNANIIVGGSGSLSLSGGLTVNSTGGITVSSGGDITLVSQIISPYNTADIFLKHGDSDSTPCLIGSKYVSGESIPKVLYITPGIEYEKQLKIGYLGDEWQSINLSTDTYSLKAKNTVENDVYSQILIQPGYINIYSDGSDEAYGYGSLRIIHDEVQQYSLFIEDRYIQIEAPYVLNKGMSFYQFPILSSPSSDHDTKIPGTGNFYFYIDDADNLPYIRFKNNSGTYVTKAI